jgi:putative membrane protein
VRVGPLMIRNYNDHAANERTFLAWVRTGLSAITLGIVVEKGSLLALAVASSSTVAQHAPNSLGNYGGPALVAAGVVVMLGASVRFLRTTLRINDQNTHSASAVGVAAALLRHRPLDCGAIDNPPAVTPGTDLERTDHSRRTKRTATDGTTHFPRSLISSVVSVRHAGRKPRVPFTVRHLKSAKC